MNNNQLFDEHIKEQLGDYSPPVHPRIWENIVAQKEKRKPAGFWFNFLNSRNILLLTALLIAGGTGAWLLLKNTGNSKNNGHLITDNNKPSSNNTTSLPVNNDAATNNNSITGADQTNSTTNSTTRSLPDLNASNSIINTVTTNSAPVIRSEAGDGYLTPVKKPGKIAGNTKINTSPGNLATPDEDGLNNNNLPVGGTLMGRLIYTAEKIAATKKNSGELSLARSSFGFLPDCPSLERNASGNKKYLEFYAGPDYAFRSLKDTGNSAYLQKRKESSSFTSAYSAGVRFTKVFNNSVSVRAGINYSQINEKFTYKQGNLVQVTYIIDANGDTTGSYITTGSRYKTTHNKYRSIDIPLTVGYEIGNGKLHANINAGVVINAYSWQKGEVLDTTYKPVNITTGKGSSPYEFKTNAGLGFIAGVSVYYRITDKLHIMAEPYYRHNFSQMNKENLTIKQKYNTAGIRIGLRVDLR